MEKSYKFECSPLLVKCHSRVIEKFVLLIAGVSSGVQNVVHNYLLIQIEPLGDRAESLRSAEREYYWKESSSDVLAEHTTNKHDPVQCMLCVDK